MARFICDAENLNEGLNIGYGVLEFSIYLVVYLQTLKGFSMSENWNRLSLIYVLIFRPSRPSTYRL